MWVAVPGQGEDMTRQPELWLLPTHGWKVSGRRGVSPSAAKRLPSPPCHLPLFPVLTSGSAEGSLQKAEKVLKKVLEWNKDEVPNKDELVGNLYSCIGNAQIELGQMVAALQSHRKDLEIAKE